MELAAEVGLNLDSTDTLTFRQDILQILETLREEGLIKHFTVKYTGPTQRGVNP